jgi:hypothetical protein
MSGVAGLLAPMVFIGLVILQGALQPDYSHTAMPISALAAWPLGYIQKLNFYVFALLMAVNAVDLHLRIGNSPRGWIGPALLLLSCIGVFVAAVFSWEQRDGTFIEPAGHVVGAVMTFLGAGIGLVALSRRMKRDANWVGFSAYTMASGAAMLILFVGFAALAVSPGAPLHPWAGAMQRIIVAVWFTCTIVLALNLRRVSTRAPA